jgi:hypothetical protein
MNKFVLFSILFVSVVAKAENSPTIADNTQSILAKTESAPASQPTQVSSPTVLVEPVCNGPNCKVRYKHKGNIAPCAVPKTVGVCVEETGCDACCRPVTTSTKVGVQICVPPCPTKESVRSSMGGKRVVYDYGKYEAVVKSGKDGNVEVRYRKRLLGL